MARDVVSFFIFFTKTKWNSIKLVRTKGKMAISPVSFFIYQKGFVASTQIPGCLLIIKEIALIVKVIGILPRILIGKLAVRIPHQEPSRGYKRVIPKQLFGKYLVFVLVNIRSLWNISFLERVLAEMRTMLFYLFYVVFCESSENGIKEFFLPTRWGSHCVIVSHWSWSEVVCKCTSQNMTQFIWRESASAWTRNRWMSCSEDVALY